MTTKVGEWYVWTEVGVEIFECVEDGSMAGTQVARLYGPTAKQDADAIVAKHNAALSRAKGTQG
jgi:hypothetical protein